MFTDIVGFNAVVGADEAKGLQLRQRHAELVKSTLAQFGGEFVEETGDETLTILSSTVAAVRAAIALQNAITENDELSIRIGIHVGNILL